MRVGIVFAYMDNRRKGRKYRGSIQPMTGILIAALLPADIEIEVINDNSPEEVDWNRDYDLLFISSIHSDFDRARQISHYWRRRGAKTVYGGFMASTYAHLCQPFFDAVVVGDAEGCVRQIYQDFCRGLLKPIYVSSPYDPAQVPVPRFDLLAHKNLVPLTIEATRGCPFTCEFCALTGIGTRFHTRPAERVVREVQAGRQMLRGLRRWHQRRLIAFIDNNIGGNLHYLDELCEALAPLGARWGCQATFNVMANAEKVAALARAGCRIVFMGLESLNPATIADMHKHQNAIGKTKSVLELCARNGIVVSSGLLLSPVTDTLEYIQSLPARLKECGLHMPAYICFESPIPGTPHFHRLASEEVAAFLPNALLRDFSGYTLVTRPKRETTERFVEGYRWLLEHVYTTRTKLARLAEYLPHYIAGGWWLTALLDMMNTIPTGDTPRPGRTFQAGTDAAPPEASSVPFTDEDFDSEEQRQAILAPWRVTDADGYVLPVWRQSDKVYQPKGHMAISLEQLSGPSTRNFDVSVVSSQ
jgi:radical SAM superfamily enzyme YgiQ (UPF0313 family)